MHACKAVHIYMPRAHLQLLLTGRGDPNSHHRVGSLGNLPRRHQHKRIRTLCSNYCTDRGHSLKHKILPELWESVHETLAATAVAAAARYKLLATSKSVAIEVCRHQLAALGSELEAIAGQLENERGAPSMRRRRRRGGDDGLVDVDEPHVLKLCEDFADLRLLVQHQLVTQVGVWRRHTLCPMECAEVGRDTSAVVAELD